MVLWLQVFEEKVYDLLPNVKSRSLPIGPRRALNVREDARGRGYVDGLTEVHCMHLPPPPSRCWPDKTMSLQAHSGNHAVHVASWLSVAALKPGLQCTGAGEVPA